MCRIASCFVALSITSAVAFGQTPAANETGAAKPSDTPAAASKPAPYPGAAGSAAMDAERAQIWNSPAMLRGRAWLHDYCARSAKVTPEEAKEYMAELESMSPRQMKLWLLKFQEQEEMIHHQQAVFNMQRQAGVQQGLGVEQATQQAYANINEDETEKAQTAEQSLDQQQQFAQQRGMQKSADRDYAATMSSMPWGMAWANQSPWGPYAGYPMGGPGPYGGGVAAGAGHYHVHYHIAPPAPAAPAAP